MVLAGFDLYRFSVPLTAPLVLQGTPMHRREGVLLRLVGEDGAVGWGEASPLPGFSRETAAETVRDLRAVGAALCNRVFSEHPLDTEGAFARFIDERVLLPAARMAVEGAAWELWTRAVGQAMPVVPGALPRPVVSLNGLLTGQEVDLVEEARRMCTAGFRAVKLKVGRQPVVRDVALVRTVAEALGPDVALRLDANRAWRADQADAFARGIAGVPVAYLEEPLADPALLSAFVRRTGLPVALDETLIGLHPGDLDGHLYARAAVLKPTLLGGFVPALRWARRAEALGMTAVLSAAFETGVGLRGLVALAAGLPDAAAGLDTYRRLAGDVLSPRLAWTGGQIDVAALLSTPRRILTDTLRLLDD